MHIDELIAIIRDIASDPEQIIEKLRAVPTPYEVSSMFFESMGMGQREIRLLGERLGPNKTQPSPALPVLNHRVIQFDDQPPRINFGA